MENQIQTESGRFRYRSKDDKTYCIPMDKVFLEMMSNLEQNVYPNCPLFSKLLDTCAFDELAELIGDNPDRYYADEVRELFLKAVPIQKIRACINACGTTIHCDGVKDGKE